MIDLSLDDEIRQTLLGDHTLKLKLVGGIYRGKCPDCNTPNLWIGHDKPGVLRCNNETKCCYTESVRARYPEIFEEFSKRFPATEKDPDITARAYLTQNRKFQAIHINGLYSQGKMTIKGTKKFVDTVRFDMFGDGLWFWEKVIDKTASKDAGKKSNFKFGIQYGNKCWQPKNQVIKKGDTVFITEGIFHAIAFLHAKKKAVSAMACGNFPWDLIEQHKDDDITWVLAYDDEPKPLQHVKGYAEKLQDMEQKFEVAITGRGSSADWDDIFRVDQLNEKFIKQCIWRGRVFMADSMKKMAYELFGWKKKTYMLEECGNQLWRFTVNKGAMDKALEKDGLEFKYGRDFDVFKSHVSTESISNCVPRFLYIEKNPEQEEGQKYFFHIDMAYSDQSVLAALESTAPSDPRSFNNALLNKTPGGRFEGSAGDLRTLRGKWFDRKMDYVRAIPFIGYDQVTETYVFNEFGFKNEKEILVNDHGYISAPDVQVKTILKSAHYIYGDEFDTGLLNDFIKVFHLNGLGMLGFWTSTLFTHQIKTELGQMPFAELTGDPEAGKSTLIRTLWKMLGRDDWEGTDLLSGTASGKDRGLAQASNLPVVFLESDRESVDGDGRSARTPNQVNWDVYKKCTDLNGVISSRGVKNNGLDSADLIFRGAIVITQNATVQASPPMLSRIVHFHCTTAHKKQENKGIAKRFTQLKAKQLGGYLRLVLANEKAYLKALFDAYPKHVDELRQRGGLTSDRITNFHAQVMASTTALKVLFPQLDDKQLNPLYDHMHERALDRQGRLASDHPVIDEFWEAFIYLNGGVIEVHKPDGSKEVIKQPRYNHSKEKGLVAISLNEFQQACVEKHQKIAPLHVLRSMLKDSKRYPFIGLKKYRSCLTQTSINCWLFSAV